MTLLKKEISEISLRFGAIGFVILASMAAASLMADTASPLKAPIIASVTAAKSPAKVLASGERTRSTTFTVVVEFADLNSGDLMTLFAGRSGDVRKIKDRVVTAAEITSKSVSFDLDFTSDGQGGQRLVALLKRPAVVNLTDPTKNIAGRESPGSKPFDLTIDTVGPTVKGVRLQGVPGGPSVLNVTFEDDDVQPTLAKTVASYVIKGTGGTGAILFGTTDAVVCFVHIDIVN